MIDETKTSITDFVNKFFEEADTDGSGTISLEEYKNMAKRMQKRARKATLNRSKKLSFLENEAARYVCLLFWICILDRLLQC
jgi:hypothetical protein